MFDNKKKQAIFSMGIPDIWPSRQKSFIFIMDDGHIESTLFEIDFFDSVN